MAILSTGGLYDEIGTATVGSSQYSEKPQRQRP